MSLSPTIIQATDMDDLWVKANTKILWAKKQDLAYYSSLDTMMEDCLFLADNCEYSLNMGKDLWLTPTRWTTLIRQYVDPHLLMKFLDRVKEISKKGRGIIAMDMKSVKATIVDDNPRANRRKDGGCMRMMTFRNYPTPTLSLYSRTSYLGYIGGLDMMLAHKVAEQIAQIKGLNLDGIRFRWHIEMAQFHGFKSFSFILTQPLPRKVLMMDEWPEGKRDPVNGGPIGPIEEYPTWKLVRSWWKRIRDKDERGETYDDMKYGAEIRIRRRYHGHFGITGFEGQKRGLGKAEPLSTPIDQLTLDKVMFDRQAYEEEEQPDPVTRISEEEEDALLR